MSDTPRTDAKRGFHDLDTAVDAEFSEQLERELNAASKERDDALMMLGMYRMKSDEQNQRIKRLEESHSWRLIETAPSNYTWILGYDEEHGETGMIIFERGDESEPHWTDGMREWEPTHWMPLPEPPKSKEDKLSVNPIQLLGANLIKAGIGFTTEDKP